MLCFPLIVSDLMSHERHFRAADPVLSYTQDFKKIAYEKSCVKGEVDKQELLVGAVLYQNWYLCGYDRSWG